MKKKMRDSRPPKPMMINLNNKTLQQTPPKSPNLNLKTML